MGRSTILLVEDELILALDEARQLEELGYQVTHVPSGEKALEATRSGLVVDLVLMDIDLGKGMDGTEAAQAILADRDLPLIFLSSHTEKAVVEKTEGITNYGYVVKDSGIVVLDASIKMAFKLFRERRERRMSEDKYSILFNQMAMPAVVTRAPEFVYVDVNEAFLALFGYERSEVLGKTDLELDLNRNPADRDLVISALLREGKLKNHVATFSTKSGEARTVLISAELLDLGPGRYAITTIQDVTEARKAQALLDQSLAALNKAQAVAHLGSWKWHIKTDRLEWSEEMYRIFGLEKEGFTGSLPDVIARAIHPEDRERVEAVNASVAVDRHPIPLEYRIVWPNGSIRRVWAEAGELVLDLEGKAEYLTGIVQDITESRGGGPGGD